MRKDKRYWFCFEGIAGAGKTSQCERLQKELSHRYPDRSIRIVNEFSNDPIGSYLQSNIQDQNFRVECYDDLSSHLLVIADRMNAIRKAVKDDQANIVLFDRFIVSDIVHAISDSKGSQDVRHREILVEAINSLYNIEDIIQKANAEIHHFYLSVPVDVAYERVQQRNRLQGNDNELEFLSQLDTHYRNVFAEKENVHVIDCFESEKHISSLILNEIEKKVL